MFGSDSESETDGSSGDGVRINKDYAESYNNWRQKEELQKLKDKYGNVSGEEESSSSESEDEDAEALTDQRESEWLKTLAALKQKDPKIYDKSVKFYEETSDSEESEKPSTSKKKSKDRKPYLLKDYERDLIVKKAGRLSDADSDNDIPAHLPKTYFEEQKELKENLMSAIENIDENSDSDEEFLTIRKLSKEDKVKKDKEYEEWLATQDTSGGKLVGINPWDKSNLEGEEQFLSDYILNKRYRDDAQEERIPSYEELTTFEEEEDELEKQETFERKYNFRYEEPDQEFIKSYPRTVGESVRRKDERRVQKRQQAKERKQRDKEKQREELKQLKNLKKKEIMDKISLIKQVTGNEDIAFSTSDINEDFDPEKYDSMMQKAFNDDYYEDADDTKPVFEDDEEMGFEVENWDEWQPEREDAEDGEHVEPGETSEIGEETHTEPSDNKKRRKSKFAKAIAKKKPVFDPNDKTFEEYLDDYYKLDYEDMIGDQPCRFKYRSVVANDFGLSTGDILDAKDKELNQWVSVKKMSQYRTKEEEMLDVKLFQKKCKRKANVLFSVYADEKGGSSKRKFETKHSSQADTPKTKRRKSESKSSENLVDRGFVKRKRLSAGVCKTEVGGDSEQSVSTKKRNRKRKGKGQSSTLLTDDRLKAFSINPKKFKYTKAKNVNH